MRALALIVMLLATLPARAAEVVDMLLVLVSDVSRSVTDSEFAMQKDGYAAAFNDPRVLAAIRNGPAGAIAVSYVEFAGAFEVQTVTPWRVVRNAASARALTQEIAEAPRSFRGRTSISAGIDHAMHLIREARDQFEAARVVIDVDGDGDNNSGRPVQAARDDAVEAGATVNGLAIINERSVNVPQGHVQPPGGLTEWYRQNVIGGPGSFVLEVREFSQFGEAMTRKLVNEIAALPSPAGKAPL